MSTPLNVHEACNPYHVWRDGKRSGRDKITVHEDNSTSSCRRRRSVDTMNGKNSVLLLHQGEARPPGQLDVSLRAPVIIFVVVLVSNLGDRGGV